MRKPPPAPASPTPGTPQLARCGATGGSFRAFVFAGLSLLHLGWLVSHAGRFPGVPAKWACAEHGGFPPGKNRVLRTHWASYISPCPLKTSPKPHDPPITSTSASHRAPTFPVAAIPCAVLQPLSPALAALGFLLGWKRRTSVFPRTRRRAWVGLELLSSSGFLLPSASQQRPGNYWVPVLALLWCCCALQGQCFPTHRALTTRILQMGSEVAGCFLQSAGHHNSPV